ncbi:MAG: hypothetical protein U0174_03020 [Polyangiaceae bacterium]
MKKNDIAIPIPCDANWDTMTPEGRKRFCDRCKKHVHDLSQLSREEANELLARRVRDDLCVSFLYDRMGNVVFDMVDTRIVAPSRLVRAKRAAAAAAATLALSTTIACGGAEGVTRTGGAPPADMHRLGGAVAMPPPTASALEAPPSPSSVPSNAPLQVREPKK